MPPTSQSYDLNDDDRDPAHEVRDHDKEEPLGQAALLGVSGGPEREGTHVDRVEHGHIGVGNESKRAQVDAQEQERRVLPSPGPGVVQVERDAHGVVPVERPAKVGQARYRKCCQCQANTPGEHHDQPGCLQTSSPKRQRVHDTDIPGYGIQDIS